MAKEIPRTDNEGLERAIPKTTHLALYAIKQGLSQTPSEFLGLL